MTERPERPEFATAIRGYDRLQVDDYIDRLIEITADAEERAGSAEAELEFSRHTTIGPRVGQIFDLAVQEAQELRERVGQEAEQTRTRTRREADETIARARKAADETTASAERRGRETIAGAEATRDEILREVEAVGEQKASLLADLERLQQVLAAATSAATGGPAPADDRGAEPEGKAQRGKPAGKRPKPAANGGEGAPAAKRAGGQSDAPAATERSGASRAHAAR
jgi:DivIVA domain-containing protein